MPLSRLWLRCFLAGFVVILALMVLTWFTPVFRGDLTRIARVSEADFEWHAPQPAIDPVHLHASRFADADVLLLGDSFSRALVWQSVLVQRGYRVKTVDWLQVGGLCSDFTEWVRSRGFLGSVVIVQSVEREVDAHLRRSADCSNRGVAIEDQDRHAVPPPTQLAKTGLNWNETLMTGLLTTFNTARVRRSNSDVALHDTVAKPLPAGCRWFSHRLCDKGLFLARDFTQPRLGEQTLQRMMEVNAAQTGLHLLWLIAPNKSSVYFERPDDPFWPALAQRGLGPNLMPGLLRDRERIADLYLPNDTHLSTAGYLRMGEQAAQALQGLLPAATLKP